MVSHDREFLQGLTDRTFEFKEGKVKEHIGTIDNFLANYKIQSFREFEGAKEKKQKELEKAKVETKAAENSGLSNKERKEKEKDWKRLKNTMSNLEQKIEEAEKTLADMEEKMHNPDAAKENPNMFYEHADVQRQLDEDMKRWEESREKSFLICLPSSSVKNLY